MAAMDPSTLAIMDAIRTILWWLLLACAALLALHFKRKGSRSTGWRLYLMIAGCIVCQTAYMTMWAVHNGAVRSVGYGRLTDTLYRICIPLYNLAMATFMGLLLALAAGYSITRSNLGAYKPQVIGLPILVFVTGVVTDYGTFQILQATSNNLQLFDMAGWEQGLWVVFFFANLAAYGFWVVYMFEIIQLEVDAIRAQQELNLVRNAAPSATVAPFPTGDAAAGAAGSSSSGSSAARRRPQADQAAAPEPAPHAAPPAGLDPGYVQYAAEEGIVAYKNLLGPGQNMSHVPGADVESQEISTVADMVNFETKRIMYRRFTVGFGCFVLAQLCVLLSPVFVIDIVQEVITFFQFLIVWGFLATLAWLFRPAENSPYLLMGEGLDTLDTALGVEEQEEQEQFGASFGGGGGNRANGQRSTGEPRGVQLTSPTTFGGGGGGAANAGAGSKGALGAAGAAGAAAAAAAAAGGAYLNGASSGGGVDRDAGRDQRPAAASGGDSLVLPVSLPAIKTSMGGSDAAAAAAAAAAGSGGIGGQQQRSQQQPGGVARGTAAAAPAAHFSLGDEDELHEVQLDSARAPAAEKRD